MSLFTESKSYQLYESIQQKRTKKMLVKEKITHRDPSLILTSDILLSTDKNKQTLNDIRRLLNSPEEEFNQYFLKVTENFAEFVQNLPETDSGYYSNMGGMLDHALERTSRSLFLCRTYLLPQEATFSSIFENEMLWIYAVYTAALLYDVGKIATNHIITLTDSQGKSIKQWLPYAGNMTKENATHYVFGFSEEYHDYMRWMITPLLARQLLPKEGFDLIASDNDVLKSWLSLLSDEHRQVSALLTVIPLADAQILEAFFTDKKVFRHNLSPQTIALLAKIQKDKKNMAQRLKELREKILAEQANKTETLNKINKIKKSDVLFRQK